MIDKVYKQGANKYTVQRSKWRREKKIILQSKNNNNLYTDMDHLKSKQLTTQHFHKLWASHSKEGNFGLRGHCPCQQGLATTRGAQQQGTTGNLGSKLLKTTVPEEHCMGQSGQRAEKPFQAPEDNSARGALHGAKRAPEDNSTRGTEHGAKRTEGRKTLPHS